MRILLFTGKGGVGKSTVAAGTAALSAAAGLAVPLFKLIGTGLLVLLSPLRWAIGLIAVLGSGLAAVATTGAAPFLLAAAAIAGAAYLIVSN